MPRHRNPANYGNTAILTALVCFMATWAVLLMRAA